MISEHTLTPAADHGQYKIGKEAYISIDYNPHGGAMTGNALDTQGLSCDLQARATATDRLGGTALPLALGPAALCRATERGGQGPGRG